MRFFIAFLILSTFTINCALAVQMENPLKKAKIGDWIETKTITKNNGQISETINRIEIASKDDKTAILFIEKTSEGNKTLGQEIKTLISPFCEEIKGSDLVKIIAEGNEKLTCAGKTFNCHWIKYQYTLNNDGKKTVTTGTVWSSPEAPILNAVKTVVNQKSNSSEKSLTCELKAFGKGN